MAQVNQGGEEPMVIDEDPEDHDDGKTKTKFRIPIIIKWQSVEYSLDIDSSIEKVIDLKILLEEKTGVLAERQKLLNLMYQGRQAGNDLALSQLNLKPGHKVLLMGSLEKDIALINVAPEERPHVLNDLEGDINEDENESLENNEIYLAKIARRIREYQISEINSPREGKKLLVLDIDYTLFDHRSTASSGVELMRPYLHEFLTSCYNYYDIAIWSATSMKWILEKMKLLGVTNNPNYKISLYLDYLAMITVCTNKYGVTEIKPLGVIWGKYPQYSAKNTIMLDDLRRNFIMNPQCGLKIRPYRQAHLNREKDRELKKLTRYLRRISQLDDFSNLNHRKWESSSSKNPKSHRHHHRNTNSQSPIAMSSNSSLFQNQAPSTSNPTETIVHLTADNNSSANTNSSTTSNENEMIVSSDSEDSGSVAAAGPSPSNSSNSKQNPKASPAADPDD